MLGLVSHGKGRPPKGRRVTDLVYTLNHTYAPLRRMDWGEMYGVDESRSREVYEVASAVVLVRLWWHGDES